MSRAGDWRTFGGRSYKAFAFFKSKSAGKAKQKRYGGRLLPTPKSMSEYKRGYRWTLYVTK